MKFQYFVLIVLLLRENYSSTLFELELANSGTPGYAYQFEPY